MSTGPFVIETASFFDSDVQYKRHIMTELCGSTAEVREAAAGAAPD